VATLDEGARAPGRHTVALDGGALRAGVYLVRLEADGAAGRRVATTRVVNVD